jgi:hypothetical protein
MFGCYLRIPLLNFEIEGSWPKRRKRIALVALKINNSMQLTLTLFMAGFSTTDHTHNIFAFNDLAVAAHFFYRSTHFHWYTSTSISDQRRHNLSN